MPRVRLAAAALIVLAISHILCSCAGGRVAAGPGDWRRSAWEQGRDHDAPLRHSPRT